MDNKLFVVWEGVDEVTAEEYAATSDDNLQSLYQRYKEGNYVATFVRRIWIDKEDWSQQLIGIPVFESKNRFASQNRNYQLINWVEN